MSEDLLHVFVSLFSRNHLTIYVYFQVFKLRWTTFINTNFPELNIFIVYIQFRLDDVFCSRDAVKIMTVFNKNRVYVYAIRM